MYWGAIRPNYSLVALPLPTFLESLLPPVIQPPPKSNPYQVLLKPPYLSSNNLNIILVTFFLYHLRCRSCITTSVFLPFFVESGGRPLSTTNPIVLCENLSRRPWQNPLRFIWGVLSLWLFVVFPRSIL